MIEFRDVCAGYDGKDVLRHVSLTVPRGSITTLVGPNGCGKTTLLRTAARLMSIRQGSVSIDGQDVQCFTRTAFARKVAFLPQQRPIPSLTVRALVEHGRFPHTGFPHRLTAQDSRFVDDAMAFTGVSAWQERDVRALSGGERQRVYVAMVVAQDTDVILLDEPTTYLDLRCQFEVLELVRALNGRGKTVVMVLHDVAQALRVSDRIALMQAGRIALCGTPEEIYQSGQLDGVLGVRAHQTPDGHYYFTPA